METLSEEGRLWMKNTSKQRGTKKLREKGSTVENCFTSSRDSEFFL